GGRNHQPAAALLGELRGDALQVVGLPQGALRRLDHRVAGAGEAEDAVALAHQQIDAELALEDADLLADRWLRCAERMRGARDAEAFARDATQVAQLLQSHRLLSK